MPRKRSRRQRGDDDALEPYRRVRKAVPPPSRPIPDRRRKAREEQADRDVREDLS